MTDTSDNAVNLFRYLSELAKLGVPHIKHIRNYDSSLWFSEIPRDTKCRCIAWNFQKEEDEESQDESWLEIPKPILKAPPDYPGELENWVIESQLTDSSINEPQLRNEVIVTGEPDPETGEENTSILKIEDYPHISEMWISYVDSKWKAWSIDDQVLQRIQDVYSKVYAFYQRVANLVEEYEVVVGLGCLAWNSPNSGDVRHPLVTFQANIDFERKKGVLKVGSPLEGLKAKLEIDFLESEDRPTPNDLDAIQKEVGEFNYVKWDKAHIEGTLSSLSNCISTQCIYDPCLDGENTNTTNPVISFSPILILRKRTTRTLVDYYRQIIEQIQISTTVPSGIKNLVEDVVESLHQYENTDRTDRKDVEIYFPLPSNEEQKKIVQAIEKNDVVLVKGPPGTGKSHTIANLMAHFLAEGKRVLVTSQTPRALQVLKNKLPVELQPLCVVWLGSDPESFKALAYSVEGILQKTDAWDREHAKQDLGNLSQRLIAIRGSIAKTQNDLIAIREADSYQHRDICGRYSGTLQEIAITINNNAIDYEWFLDHPQIDDACPIDTDELQWHRTIHTKLNNNIVDEFNKVHLDIGKLVSSAEFTNYVLDEKQAREKMELLDSARQYAGYEELKALDTNTSKRLRELILSILRRVEELSKHYHQWASKAVLDIAADQDRSWRVLLDETNVHIRTIKELPREVLQDCIVSGIEGHDLLVVYQDASVFLKYLEGGGKLKKFVYFRPKEIRQFGYLIDTVRINGRQCDTPDTLLILIGWIDSLRIIDSLKSGWIEYADVKTGKLLSLISKYEDLCEPIESALAIYDSVSDAKVIISKLPALATPRWHFHSDLKDLGQAIDSAYSEAIYENIAAKFTGIDESANDFLEQTNAHDTSIKLAQALLARSIDEYEKHYSDVVRIQAEVDDFKKFQDVLRKFKEAAPFTADLYQKTYRDDVWIRYFEKLTEAWDWARTNMWLTRMLDEDSSKHLMASLNVNKQEELKVLGQIAEIKSWDSASSSLNSSKKQALRAWQFSVERIRGGTSRHAEQYRQEAKKKLSECRDAIPAWVMPIYQLVETSTPEIQSYDVVIVDEASQSGPEALFINYISKKTIVVGDDKQIAPARVGVKLDDVEQLRQRYLRNIPHNNTFGLDSTLYSQTQIRSQENVQLREHFRCMPEIIQFSNKLCYSDQPLIPLKQFGTDRLEPVKSTYISTGYRDGKQNKPEAKALVEQIAECIEDPEYADKSMGVITLLGNEQAALIMEMLVDEIGASQVEVRHISCGNAYQFQGDERDVMFLSMVDAPEDGRPIRMVRDLVNQRSFNVAASRARDQMWLFHSFTLNDADSRCLRYQLLEYCQNPKLSPDTIGDLNIENLRTLASDSRRREGGQPTPFDSWFEVDVFLMVHDRGYRVIPQYEVDRFRIDLVVEGMAGKLAVECDGERWHGPNRYLVDMDRQRQLERCDWSFWRVRGGQFYRNRELALEPLWEELKRLEINPGQVSSDSNKEEQVVDSTSSLSSKYGSISINPTVEEKIKKELSPSSRSGRRTRDPTDVPAKEIQETVVKILQASPNCSSTVKSMTKKVLIELGITTRGNPRLEFGKRVLRNLKSMEKKKVVKIYTAKNERVRLLDLA